MSAWIRALISVNLLWLGVILPAQALAAPPEQRPEHKARAVPRALHDRALAEGEVRVLVELALPSGRVAESKLAIQARAAYRQEISDTAARVLSHLSKHRYRVLRRYLTSPVIALAVGPAALKELEASGLPIRRVAEDRIHKPVLWDSVPLIGADQAWAVGFDGSGRTVAIIDSGVDTSHPFLAGKVVDEACYSTTSGAQSTTLCPNGADEQVGPGAGVYCPLELEGCWHGTHVAGIVAGDGTPFDLPIWGVGRGASIMPIQVFSQVNSFLLCGGAPPCLGAFTSDILAALERVYELRTTHDFAAVNMSLGGGLFSAACDDEPYKPFIDNLRAAGIATVVASGNDGSTDQMSAPACVSSAVSVGATTKDDRVADYSNVAPFMSLFAPGDEIISSYPGENFAVASGTSMAAPHVAGAWAILKQAAPTATVDEILQALTSTGLPIADLRAGTGTTRPRIQVDLALSVLLGENQDPPALSVNPPAQDFGTVTVGSSADRTFVVQNTGGGILTGTASTTAPFSIVSGGSFNRGPNGTQNVVVRFGPTAPGVFTANVVFTSNGGDFTVAVTGIAAGVSGIAPNAIDLASPPTSFTITGNGFANLGFGLPVVNFMRNGALIAQARTTAMTSTTLTVPYPTQATAITPNMPGLSAGSVQAQVWMQTSATPTFTLIGSATLTVTDTRGVSGITPSSIDLAAPPASFTITGGGFVNMGFGLPMVNFVRNGTLIAQARATGLTGNTTLAVPFPTQATAMTPNMPGLSAGTVQAQVWIQTSATPTFSSIGSATLTVTDTRPVPGVTGITPSPIDLVDPPAGFTITGNGFANLGFGLPMVNFVRNGVLIAQARATALVGSTTLTVPYPTQATAITPNMPGLAAGQVQAQVWQQTGSAPTFSLIGSATLTVVDTRGVSGIAPNAIDLATPPATVTINGGGFANLGFGLPVVNFMRGTTLLAQARATALTGNTTLTVPFPTQATAITPNLPGLSAGAVQAQVWQQTGSSTFTLIGSAGFTVTDTRPTPGVTAITPNPVNLLAPPASFMITGNGFANLGFGLPVVNFVRGTTLLAQARATALTGTTTLTVPFPTQATAITPNLPGLSVGLVQAQVWQQTSAGSFTLIGTVTLTATASTP
jgi:subtilisin family serine protease